MKEEDHMTDVNLYKKVSHLNGLLQRRKLRRRASGGPGDPTRGQGRIVAMLKLQDGIATKDLSYLLGMRVASLNEMLAKLERAGLIRREPSEADGRVMLIKLTDEGRAQEQANPDTGGAFATLTDDEKETLGGLLDRVIEVLEAETQDVDAEALSAWMDEARVRMGDEKFDQWMGLLTARFGEDGYQHMADRLRRNLERAQLRDVRRAGRRRGGPGPRGPEFDEPGFGGPGPRGHEFGGPGFGGPGFYGPGPRGPEFGRPGFGRPGPEWDDVDGDEPGFPATPGDDDPEASDWR